MDYGGSPLPGLLRAVGVKLDAVANDLGAAGDRLERYAIADARIERRRGHIGKHEESVNPLGLGEWQGIKAEPTFADKAHTNAPFSEKLLLVAGPITLPLWQIYVGQIFNSGNLAPILTGLSCEPAQLPARFWGLSALPARLWVQRSSKGERCEPVKPLGYRNICGNIMSPEWQEYGFRHSTEI